MVSIKDVARVAGVSDKTVSRVVNREANVHPETVEKVEQAIADLNYIPNLGARMVRTSRSRTIGIMTDLVSTTPYSGDIVRGAQDWARQADRTVLITNTGGSPEEEARGWRTFLEHRIDGVIYATMSHREVALERASVAIPTVLVNCYSGIDPDFPAIVPDDSAGSSAIAEHLVGLGHHRIGYVQLNPVLRAAGLRLEAFREALARHEISLPDELVRDGMYGEVGQDINVAYESTHALLALADRPTAIACGNDEIALQVYCAVLDLGLRIPTDVSVVGFDDFHTVSHGLRPKLTTAALPYHALGFEGAKLLEALLGGEMIAGKRLANCPLVVHHSTTRVSA